MNVDARLKTVPSQVWDREDMRNALANRDIQAMYKILNRHGVTQRTIGFIAEQSQSEVSEILKGRKVVSYATLERICTGFGIPRSRMGLAYAPNSAPANVKQDDGPSMMELAWKAVIPDKEVAARVEYYSGPTPAPSKVSMVDVEAMEEAFQAIQKLDQMFGGQAQFITALALIKQCKTMLRASMKDAVKVKLARKVGWIHSFAGWTAIDSGQRDTSLYHFAQALQVSHETNDLLGRCRALYQSGRAELHYGDPNQALKLFQLGTLPAQDIESKGFMAAFLANASWACSMTDHKDKSERYIKQSKEAYLSVSPEKEQGNLLGFVKWSDILSCTGMAYSNMHQLAKAEKDLTKGLQARDSINVRSKAFEEASLAHVHLLAGHRDQGLEHGRRAVELGSQVRSKRLTVRLAPMRQAAKAYGHTDTSELVHEVDQLCMN